jgi:hypothetical protein
MCIQPTGGSNVPVTPHVHRGGKSEVSNILVNISNITFAPVDFLLLGTGLHSGRRGTPTTP